jgi:hypothetical protein
MPQLPVAPSAVKISFHFSYGTDANVMTHMYFAFVTGTPNTADLQGFTNTARSLWVTNMLSLMTNAVTLRNVDGIWLGDYTSALVTASGSNSGTRLGGVIPASTAALINLKLSRRYRGGKPRLYLPLGAQTDFLDAQHWSSAFITAVTTGWNAWVNGMQAYVGGPSLSALSLANVSYWHLGGLRPTPLVEAVTSSGINSIPATQRRRLRP